MSSAPFTQMTSGTSRFPNSRTAPRWRMMWKEFRQIAPMLIIFIAILSLVLALHQANYLSGQYIEFDGNANWHTIIWGFVCLFSLTVGMSLFSTEHENKTIQMLRNLPFTSGFVVRNKLLSGSLTIMLFIAFGLVLQLVEVYGIGRPFELFSDSENPAQLFFLFCFVVSLPLECFFWGVIWSMSLKRTIFAALAAVASIFFCFWFLHVFISWFFPSGQLFWSSIASGSNGGPFFTFVTWVVLVKLLTYVGMGFACYSLGKNWLGNAPQLARLGQSTIPALSLQKNHQQTASKYFAASNTTSNSWRIYQSLIWQTLRQNKKTIAWASAAVVGLQIFFIVSYGLPMMSLFEFWLSLGYSFSLPTLFVAMFAFSSDQHNSNYRFFQQHTEYGRKLWACRLLPAALFATASIVLLAASAISALYLKNPSPFLYALEVTSIGIMFTVSAFAIGQFSSMMTRSGVYAFADALMLGVFLSSWFSTIIALNGSLWLFYLPAPVALVAVTWWRAPDWLADKTRIRDHALTCSILALVICCVITSFFYFRFAHSPQYSFGMKEFQAAFDSLDSATDRSSPKYRFKFLNDAANLTVDINAQVHDFSRVASTTGIALKRNLIDDVEKVVKQNAYPLSLINEADEYGNNVNQAKSRGEPLLTVLSPVSAQHRKDQVNKIGFLIAAQAQLAEQQGELDSALASWLRLARIENEHPGYGSFATPIHLIRWSELPNQDPKLIKKAIKGLSINGKQWRAIATRLSESLHLDLLNWVSDFKEGKTLPPITGSQIKVSSSPVHMLPWELKRSEGIGRQELSNLANTFSQNQHLAEVPDQHTRINWSQNRLSTSYSRERFTVHPLLHWGTILGLRKIQDIRYAQVRMALNAWRIENGAYPDELSELVPEYLPILPVDVISGKNFAYSKNGLDEIIGWNLPAQIEIPDNNSSGDGFDIHSDEIEAESRLETRAVVGANSEDQEEFINNMNVHLKASGLKLIKIPVEPTNEEAANKEKEKISKIQEEEMRSKQNLRRLSFPIIHKKQYSTFVASNTPFLLPWSANPSIPKREIIFANQDDKQPTTPTICRDYSPTEDPLRNRGGVRGLGSFDLKPVDQKRNNKSN